jgi:hypothetical protein
MFHQNEQSEIFLTAFIVDGPTSTIFNQNPLGTFEHDTTCEQISTSSVFYVHFTPLV